MKKREREKTKDREHEKGRRRERKTIRKGERERTVRTACLSSQDCLSAWLIVRD